MTPHRIKPDFYFNNLMNSDCFPQLYFIFQDNSIFCAWGPPQVFEKFFFFHSVYDLHGSIEQCVLITNITFFFNISRIIRDIQDTFDRQKNQFLAQKSINTCIKFIENRAIRCKMFFSIRIDRKIQEKKLFLNR